MKEIKWYQVGRNEILLVGICKLSPVIWEENGMGIGHPQSVVVDDVCSSVPRPGCVDPTLSPSVRCVYCSRSNMLL